LDAAPGATTLTGAFALIVPRLIRPIPRTLQGSVGVYIGMGYVFNDGFKERVHVAVANIRVLARIAF